MSRVDLSAFDDLNEAASDAYKVFKNMKRKVDADQEADSSQINVVNDMLTNASLGLKNKDWNSHKNLNKKATKMNIEIKVKNGNN